MATVGKRLSIDDPLTEHDVAERLDKAALRTLSILMDTRERGMMPDVKASRYHSNVLHLLRDEVALWTSEQVADEQCGDYPAPCNCDNPGTHTGRH